MQQSDAKSFAMAMDRLFSIYGAQITKAMREAWWGALSEFKLGEVMEAMTLHAKDPDGGRFVPTPAHIIQQLGHASALRRKIAADIRAEFGKEIHAIEDRLYRARHDLQLERIDTAAATVIIADCHQRLRTVNATMRARLTQEGHYADENPDHAQRVIGA